MITNEMQSPPDAWTNEMALEKAAKSRKYRKQFFTVHGHGSAKSNQKKLFP